VIICSPWANKENIIGKISFVGWFFKIKRIFDEKIAHKGITNNIV